MAFGPNCHDSWLDEITQSNENEVSIILPDLASSYLSKDDKKAISELLQKYRLRAMF